MVYFVMDMDIRSKINRLTRLLMERFQRLSTRLLRIPAIRLIFNTIRELGVDDATTIAAGIAYYAFLALFPLVLGLIALIGLFLPSETVQRNLFDFFSQNFPGSVDVLEQNIREVIALRGALGVISIVGLLWSGSAMFGAVSHAINRAWNITRERPFYIKKVRELIMALSAGVLFLFYIGGSTLVANVGNINLPVLGTGANLIVELATFLVILAIFLLVYRFIPNTRIFWRDIWLGALVAAVFFELGRLLFVLYLTRFANYQLVYGSVASIVIFLVWIYYSSFFLILGAELSSEYSRMRREAGREQSRRT